MTICYHKEEFRPLEETMVPLSDMAVQRGIGVFEVICTYQKRPYARTLHLDRLAESAQMAGISIVSVMDEINSAITLGLEKMDTETLIKPYITGGDVRDIAGKFPAPRVYVIFAPAKEPDRDLHKNGIKLQPTDTGRPNPLLKSINYLFGYIPTLDSGGAFEALYCPGGVIKESTSSSFFMCASGKIVTAPVGEVLDGITRRIVLSLAREAGFKIEERCPTLDELASADEAFITGSVKEVLGVIKVGNQKIGSGTPGPVTAHLHRLFKANIKNHLG